jgi:spore coat protein U-like protein
MKRIVLAVCFLLSTAPLYAINCSWDIMPTNINFGTYFPFTSPAITGTSNFQFTCTPPAIGNMTLSRGSSPTFNPRTMTKAGGATVNYNLYMDAANTIIWGDGTSGTQFVSFPSQPNNKTYAGTIYATIPAGLNVAAGTYTDTVQVTLDWGTGTSNLFITMTVTVSAECTVNTTSVNFGAYDPVVANAATPLDATGTVNVYCTTGTLATVSLDLGTHFTGTTRRMLAGAANFLTYEIYRDAARTVVWNTVNTNSGTSTSKTIAINNGFIAYGRIPSGQDVTMGAYGDTLLVTVNY